MAHLATPLSTFQETVKAEQQVPSTEAPATPAQSYAAKKRAMLTEYQQAFPNYKALINSWTPEINETESNRKLRNIDLSPKKLREEGKLLPDETIIPMRIIDTNINREQPAYINYLKNSPRTAVFAAIENPAQDNQLIEAEFTRVMTYPEWDIPFQRCIDGSEVHGYDYVEVVLDISKPGHVAVEHVGRDNLFYNKDSIRLQANAFLIRRYSFSISEIEEAVHKHGFNEAQAQKIIDAHEGIDKQNRNVYIYKALVKCDGYIEVIWFCLEHCDGWLKEPAPLYLGLQKKVKKLVPVPVTTTTAPALTGMGGMPMMPPPQPQMQEIETLEDEKIDVFPIFVDVYKETEEQQIIKKKGRVFLDKHKQEGQTAMASAYVNAQNRAAKIFGSVGNAEVGDTSPPKQIDSPLVNGGIYDKPIQFWSFPSPDPTTLSALQYFDSNASQEAGQVNFAAVNRKDSRKTATEIGAAQEDQAMLTSNQVSLLSTFLRLVYSFCWRIVQNRALNGHITFLAIPQQVPDIMSGGSKTVYVNNVSVIGMRYDIRPAGDIDVVKRQQMMQQLRQDFPLFAQTPLAGELIKEMIRVSYPGKAATWIPFLDQQSAKDAVIQKFMQLLMMASPLMQGMPPAMQQAIAMLLEEAQMALQSNGLGQPMQPQQQPQQQQLTQ